MPKKSSEGRVINVSAVQQKRPTKGDLERLKSAMKGDIDTSDIPVSDNFKPLQRDATGVLPQRKSMIRDAVDKRRKQLGLTPYRLWQLARPHHASLSQSAVHEFLKGRRQLELPSAEALLIAMELNVIYSSENMSDAITVGSRQSGAKGSARSRAKNRMP